MWDVLYRLFKNLPQLISAEMLERAKGQVKGSLVLSLESTSNRMNRLLRGELDEGAIVTPEEMIARIEAVSCGDLMELAGTVYNPEKWTWAALGPRHLIKEEQLWQKIC